MKFVRVRDKTTRHQFDVPETDRRIGEAFELIKSNRYPPVNSPRRPKHYQPPKRASKKGETSL